MYTNLQDALNYIENRRVRHTLAYFKNVLDSENIDYSLPCIHVTGTNGKGGTINFISHILQEAGYKVGTFTSPYIVCHQDRFMINGKMMDDDLLLTYINNNLAIIEKYNLAMFEIDFIIMLQYFKAMKVDLALIEVGIGARNDKTNMVMPLASVITNVGKDHLAQIGPTLLDVAYEKAGIIKEGVPAFTSLMADDIMEVLHSEATLKHAPLHVVKETNLVYELQLEGLYHQKNACLAIEVIRKVFPHISEENIKAGLKKATWPGRFERFEINQATYYLDGAHNLHAFESLMPTVASMNFIQQPIFIYAALQDKDYKEMAQMILDEGYPLEVCKFSDGRALSEKEISEMKASKVYESIDDVLKQNQNANQLYIVCGSLHFISQFRNKIIQKK